MDQIAIHTNRSPLDRGEPAFPSRSKSHLKVSPPLAPFYSILMVDQFDEEDVVHQYGYGRDDDATHEHRAHPPPRLRQQASSSSASYPVIEETEDELNRNDYAYDRPQPPSKSPTIGGHYVDPYSNLQPARPRLESSDSRSSASSLKGFAGMFNFSHSADPSKAGVDTRGGAHRGTRDYPHLSKKDKAVEKEERRGLVVDTDGHGEEGEEGDLAGRGSREEEPRSAVTEESLGHVMRAERWTPLRAAAGNSSEGRSISSGIGGPRGPRGPAR
jgi:hypothetical protein